MKLNPPLSRIYASGELIEKKWSCAMILILRTRFVGLFTVLILTMMLAACAGDDIAGGDAVDNDGNQENQNNQTNQNNDNNGTTNCQSDSDCDGDDFCRNPGDDGVCETPTNCGADDDCTIDDDRCVVEREDDVRVICNPPVGDGELGDDCITDDECAAGLCLDDVCSHPCNNPSDCDGGEEYVCTPEDLGGGVEVNVCTERPLDLCFSDAECDGADRCVATVEDEELKFVCGDPNIGGGEGGDACTDDSECAQNLCLDGACAAPCDDDDVCDDIPASHCGTATVERDDAQGTVSTCDVPTVCSSVADCGDDETCYVLRVDDAVDTICEDPNASNRTNGQACTNDAQCASNYCHEDSFGSYCSTPCQTDDNCPVEVDGLAMECGEVEIDHLSGSETIDACVYKELQSCNAALDCDDQNMTCNRVTQDSAGDIDGAVCGFSNPGAGALGASCSDQAECESDFCWTSDDGSTGECSVFCDDSGRDCANDQLCVGMVAGLGACLGECSRNEDCDGGNVCQVGTGQSAGDLYQVCNNTIGDGETGDACTDTSDCDTGLCMTISTYDVTDQSCTFDSQCESGFECGCPPGEPGCINTVCVSIVPSEEQSLCTEFCDAGNGDADCQVGNHDLTVCSDNITQPWNGGTEYLSACSLPDSE